MIIKTLSRKSNSAQLIKYALRYSLKENAFRNKEDAQVVLRHNLRTRSVKGYIREYTENETFRLYRRKDSVTLFHDILSFAPGDKELVDAPMLKDIAKKYVSLRGKNNLYLIVSHNEKAHTHLHCLVSGVNLAGYSARLPKAKYKQLLQELEQYQQEKYPQLVHSRNSHEKLHLKTREEIIGQIKRSRQTSKQTLAVSLEQIYAKATSIKDFQSLLAAAKLEPYYRNGKFQGVVSDGKKFRLSRLRYDETKMQELEVKVQQEVDPLQELEAIRNGINKPLEREILKKEKTARTHLNPYQNSLLDEIDRIRQQQEEKAIAKPTLERTLFTAKEDEPYNDNTEADTNINPFRSRIKFNIPQLITDDATN
jgi:Relaxase/Mobilisation nuclease domain